MPQILVYLRRKLPAIGSLIVGVLVGLFFANAFSRDVGALRLRRSADRYPAAEMRRKMCLLLT